MEDLKAIEAAINRKRKTAKLYNQLSYWAHTEYYQKYYGKMYKKATKEMAIFKKGLKEFTSKHLTQIT